MNTSQIRAMLFLREPEQYRTRNPEMLAQGHYTFPGLKGIGKSQH